MAELLQMAGNITYSTAGNYGDLLSLFMSVQLIAMAYHPFIQNLLFMLYAIPPVNVTAVNNKFQLQIWQIDKPSRSVVHNITLTQYFNINQLCQMEVSSRILLIQCQTRVTLYEITSNGKSLVNSTAFFSNTKNNITNIGISNIQRRGALSNQKFVYYNGTDLIVTTYNINDTSITINNTYLLSIGGSFIVFSIFMSQDYIIWGLDKNDTKIAYTYLPCLLYGYNQTGNSCGSSSIVTFLTGFNITKNFRIKQTNSSDQRSIMWVLINGNVYRYQLFPTSPLLKQQFTGQDFEDLSYNNQSILFFNSNRYYQLRSFQVQTINSQIAVYRIEFFFELVAINSAETQLTIFDGNMYQVADQYQIIKNCQTFNAWKIDNFCYCQSFDGIFCSLATATSNGQTTGLPSFVMPVIAAVGAAVGITLIVIVTRFVYKKYCKTPKNNRVPYKYEQTQLMSFQM